MKNNNEKNFDDYVVINNTDGFCQCDRFCTGK
jgi:hypothetical protein